jgi:hypothetical protein
MRIEVLRNPPSLGLGEFQRHPTCDAQSPLSQSMITRRVGSGQQGFHPVHVGIDAAVALEMREISVPGIDEHARHIVEEPLPPHLERLAEQVASAGQPCNRSRRGGKHHKGVGIAGLLIRTVVCVIDAGQPATVPAIPEPAGQAGQGLCCKISIGGPTEQLTEGVDMQHPGGDPCVDGAREIRLSASIQPGSSTQRMRKVAAEVEQPLTFGR